MSKTYKHKTLHIFHLVEEGARKLSDKLKWSHIHKINRHNLDYDLEREELSKKKERISKDDMRMQLKDLD